MTPAEMKKLARLVAKEILSLQDNQTSAKGRLKTTKAATPGATAPIPLEPGGAVWILRGGKCKCRSCHKLIYEVITDVPENVNLEILSRAFKPLNGAPKIGEGVSIFGDPSGNLAIDCPLCKGVKTLWIRGEGEYEGQVDNT